MKTALLTSLCIGFAGLGAVNFMALKAEAASPTVDAREIASVTDIAEPQPDDQSCLSPALVERIAPRHKELLDREAELSSREAELVALEVVLKDRLERLEASHTALKTISDKLDASATQDISHLVKMYSSMKPKKAASIFDKMDPAFAAGFIREIEGARAGLILSEMNIQQSYRVSLLIANRQAEWRNGSD